MASLAPSRITRRDFLRQTATAAAALPVLGAPAFLRRTGSAVVIGAGLSGLAAANALRAAGWDVTVVEARDRVGGRVLSHRFADAPGLVCELGGEWIGASHERLQALCAEAGIALQDHRFEASLLRGDVVSEPDAWRFSPAADAGFERLRTDYAAFTDADRRRLDAADWWSCLEARGFSDDDLRLRDLMDSTDFGESIRHVSAFAAASEYFESSPANEMDFKMEGGNSRLTAWLASRVGRERIRLRAPATAVRQRGGRVEVDAGGDTLSADACVCTAPSRTLDRIAFDPPLPLAQADAAEQLQYARIVKTQVLCADRFWGRDDFSLVSDVTSHYYFHSTQRQPGRRGILCSYAVGDKADVLAAQPDARRMQMVLDDLEPLDERAPTAGRGVVSAAWQRDPHTGGAYALYRPGQWFTVRPVLQQPHGRVLFAGEHLADWQGFMEGAVATGEEAAAALVS